MPLIRRLSSSLGQGSKVLVFLAELSPCPTVELPARWDVTAVESEKLCKRRKRFSNSAEGKALENELRASGNQKTRPKIANSSARGKK